MATSHQNEELLSDDQCHQNTSIHHENHAHSNHSNTPRFHFQTSSRIQEPIDTSVYCNLHCKKQIFCILSLVLLIAAGYITLKLGYFFIGVLLLVISILFMIYGCTVGYVCCRCFQKTRYEFRFDEDREMLEVWSSSNKLFAEQEIPFIDVQRFKMQTIQQTRVVYGNAITGSYEDCAVVYVQTKSGELVRINKYFAVGDEIEHARVMLERLNKYWISGRHERMNAILEIASEI